MQEMHESEVADQFVKGLDYPTAKADIVTAAREVSLSQAIQEAVAGLPERAYLEPEDLTQALNAS